MRTSIKRATAEIITLMESCFQEDMVDDEREWFESEIEGILDSFFSTDSTVSSSTQSTISFTPDFNVSTNVAPTATNSTPKENEVVGHQKETRASYNSSSDKTRRQPYKPRRDSNPGH